MTQTIDTKTVRHVANLARLGISDEEAETFSGQFSAIIEYFHMLNEVDTSNVPPASDVTYSANALREDVVQPSMSREEFLKNAPKVAGSHIKAPTVLGDE